uniref:Uncharacterized protein n=1 Tax=Kuenenia stuttgartiensis TaxID=174633 RepID=Q1PXS9_KUEST|nr:unknown protein [Candidatus Kuenenia stuttgartiensis]
MNRDCLLIINGACLEFQIILSLEFVSYFVFRISRVSYFTIKYFDKNAKILLISTKPSPLCFIIIDGKSLFHRKHFTIKAN